MKLLVFAASHRTESFNRKLAKFAAASLDEHGVAASFAEYGEFDMPIYNDATATKGPLPDEVHSFARRVSGVDGIIICSPEYNWSYPGSLKNIIDWTSRIGPNPLAGKTVLLMSASPSSRGGILGLNHLKLPLESAQMFVFPRMFPLGNSPQAFDNAGNLTDPKQRQLCTDLLKDYVTFTKKLSK